MSGPRGRCLPLIPICRSEEKIRAVHTTFFCADRNFDAGVVEMMDRRQAISTDLRNDLENLGRLNRYFGSYALVDYFLEKWCRPEEQLVLIDLCTGFGDIPRVIVDWCRLRRIRI